MDGEVTASVAVPAGTLTRAALAVAVQSVCGTQVLPVSAYSAIKQSGVPMYKRARQAAARGETVSDVPHRTMEVYEAELLDHTDTMHGDQSRVWLHVRVSVGSGTYIRSLAEAIGRTLGYPAVLYALRRTKVGEYSVEDARTLEEVTSLPNLENSRDVIQ